MRAVLLVEGDTLIRELMREHLDREGYPTCAVGSVRIALSAARWTQFALVMLDFTTADACSPDHLDALRGLGAPVVMMRSAPAGTVIGTSGDIEQVVWSPFDLTTLTQAVRRFLPIAEREARPIEVGPEVKESGTYTSMRPERRPIGEITTLPAPADDADASDRRSLDALGKLVLASTGGRRVG